MTKIKIALAITLAEHGGAQSHVYDLVSSLKDRFSFLVLIGQEGWLSEKLRGGGVEVAIVPALVRDVKGFGDVAAIFEMMRIIRGFGPQLIHLHSSKAGLIGRIVAHWVGVPAIYTVHGWGFKAGVPIFRRLLVWFLEQLLIGFSRAIVCVSNYDSRLARQYLFGASRRVRVIWNGVPDTEYRRDAVGAGSVSVAMVARFQEPKLQELLIQVFASDRRFSNIDLVFVGDGPRLQLAESLAHRLGVRCQFFGSRSDVPEILSKMDIFVLLSAYEGLPVSIIEAMRAGLPVVASRVGGVEELIVAESTGILVSNELEAVSSALLRLIESSALRRRLGRSGRERYEEFFCSSNMCRDVAALYESVLTP
jgi:glycosyltransferase involved in cell wall biosynthesis